MNGKNSFVIPLAGSLPRLYGLRFAPPRLQSEGG
jgi:hypothetical protein